MMSKNGKNIPTMISAMDILRFLLVVLLSTTTTMAADTPPLAPSPTISPFPTSMAPVTSSPVTPVPVTAAPVTPAPITAAPVTPSPVTPAPVTPAPVTDAPTIVAKTNTPTFLPSTRPSARPSTLPSVLPSLAPVTASPVSKQPVTAAPVTSAPITNAPVTTAPVTKAPVTSAPITAAPVVKVTLSPVTMAPVVLPSVFPSSMPSVFPSSTPSVFPSNMPSAFPSSMPSAFPSNMPSAFPSNMPSVFSSNVPSASEGTSDPIKTQAPASIMTQAPTQAPAEEIVVEVSHRFSIQLFSVTTRMSEDNSETFNNAATLFLGELLAMLEQPIMNIKTQVVGQELLSSRRGRNLQELVPIEVEMTVEGNFIAREDGATEPDDINLSKLSRQFFDAQQDKFVKLLQESESGEDVAYFASVNAVASVDEPGDNGTPASAPSPPPASDGGDGLAIGGIIAISLCGFLAVLLVGALVYQRMRRAPLRQSAGGADSSRTAPNAAGKSRVSGSSKKSESKSALSEKLSSEQSGLSYASSNYEAQSDTQSQFGADTFGGADTMSYAYSLDHGLDASVVSGPGSDYFGHSASGGSVPTEIPMVSSLDDMSKANNFTRECFAPPGRLGIVIDTTLEGPIIHKVNPGSPLEGIVWPGDIIVAIDDTDTTTLSANEITALMAKNTNQRRKLTIRSDAL